MLFKCETCGELQTSPIETEIDTCLACVLELDCLSIENLNIDIDSDPIREKPVNSWGFCAYDYNCD